MLIVVSAPSGAGKTSLCLEIGKHITDLAYSISYTTRLPRPGEVNGRDFFIVAEPVFREMAGRGEFAEWARVHENLYGTSARFLDETLARGEDILLDIDTQGARQLRGRYPEGVYIFVVAPSMKELEQRLLERKSEAPQEIARRLKRAREEIAAWREYEYLIVNQDLDEAVQQLQAIVVAERVRTSRLTLTIPDLDEGG
jgi:guanylate kinase